MSRPWRKSQRCANGPDCVEVAWDAEGVWLRDSKDAEGPVLRFTRSAWAAFLAGARAGEFDGPLSSPATPAKPDNATPP